MPVPEWLRQIVRREWFLGGVAGTFATLLGFGLTMAWDIYKTGREDARRYQGAIAAVTDDLLANRESAQRNASLLTAEICVMRARHSIVQPMSLFRTDSWSMVRLDPPPEILAEGRLPKLRDLYYQAEFMNESIRSREMFRLSLGDTEAFWIRLGVHDYRLREGVMQLERKILDFAKGWPELSRAAKAAGFDDVPYEVPQVNTSGGCEPSPSPSPSPAPSAPSRP